MSNRRYNERCEEIKDIFMLLFAGAGFFAGLWNFELGAILMLIAYILMQPCNRLF